MESIDKRAELEEFVDLFQRSGAEAFLNDNRELDWVRVGKNTATLFGGGVDSELPSEDEHVAFETEVGEPVEIIGRPALIETV